MRRGETLFISQSQRGLIGQAKMQRFIRIEEGSGGRPKAGEEAEQM